MSQDREDPLVSLEGLQTLRADRHGAGFGQRVGDDFQDALHHLGVPFCHGAVHRKGKNLPGAQQKRQNRGGAHSEPDGAERVDELLQEDGGSGSVVWLPKLCTSGNTAVAVVVTAVMVAVAADRS